MSTHPNTRRVPVQTYRERMYCNKTYCDGEMVFTGACRSNGFTSSFEHKCNKCKTVTEFDASYPRIVYVELIG